MKEPTEILPKIPEYRDIEYAPGLICPECENSGIGITVIGRQKPGLVGWCETTYGYMVVLECPSCFTKFRLHGALIKDDLEAFNADIYKYFIGAGDADLAWVSNAIELYKSQVHHQKTGQTETPTQVKEGIQTHLFAVCFAKRNGNC